MNATSSFQLPDLQYDAILCRYNEIATKGKNRRAFERRLIRNLKHVLRPLGKFRVSDERGRIFLLPESGQGIGPAECEMLQEAIPRVFGLVSISPGFLLPPELSKIEEAVLQTFPRVYQSVAESLPEGTPIPYAMRARRNTKTFPMTSKELEIHFADQLVPQFPRLQIDLKNPRLRVEVEVRQDRAFVSYERIAGPGGLPNGSSERALALLSGGIDSPVACYKVMKRGCPLHFVTFHSAPYTPPGTVEKVARLVRVLNRYQQTGLFIAINLLPAQKMIRDQCAERFRTLLYRRMMTRLATIIARASQCQALVTGESIGQVASQTIPNLQITNESTSMLILRPLIGCDKEEAIRLARQIGTLDISDEPMPDSCTVFAPAHPSTGARLERLLEEESHLDIPELMRQCLDISAAVDPLTLAERPLKELSNFEISL
jgi:thiamine biosynthesis protein ThiI